MVNSLKLDTAQVIQHIQNCLDSAEAIRLEYGIYAAITYIQTVVSFCVKVDHPTATSILYPQRWILLTRAADLFPSQGTSYVIPDAIQALETLSVEKATVSTSEGRESAKNSAGEPVHVIRTNPKALNSVPQYELLPGRRENITLHLTLWEVKPLDPRSTILGVSFGKQRGGSFWRTIPWSRLSPIDVLEAAAANTRTVPEVLLQVLHTFLRYLTMEKVRLALIVGGCISVCDWQRPATIRRPELPATYLQKNPSLLAQYVPQEDFTPTIRMPLRWMMEGKEPTKAFRAALYLLYIEDVPHVSIAPKSDIFDIGHFAGNPYTDKEFEDDVENMENQFKNWWTRNSVPKTPEQGEGQLEPETPMDLQDGTYVVNETPGTNTLWI